ncbi:universal stress protein [Rhizobium tubonense]|uniref:Universal stress protein n=1 Tax=Rhizobium tubonense TaxID=484088 RepID=A0A2W4CFY7_9HYPH|nr:universal stress protein [Rhizobium tubonense]PZM10028.1 universal stress protein [Rhizobium tubonense]
MSFKTILSVVGMRQSAADIEIATTLCTELGAHLRLLVVSLEATSPVADYALATSSIWVEERQRNIEKLAAEADSLKESLKRYGISYEVESLWLDSAYADTDIGDYARYSDLVVVGPSLSGDDEELKWHTVNGALFEAMRPVLIVPDKRVPSLKPKTILLAWNSTLEASRGAREGLDIMAGAEVHITLVDPDATCGRNGEEPGADIALYLARHDINATVDRLPSAGRDISDVLNQHAIDISADLIVMGGYGHSRLRERIFGGVTRTMIKTPKLPVLMAR